MIIVVAAGTAAVTLMVGLVTNAASEQQQWPGLLAYVQQYPWQSLAALAVVTVVLTSVFAVLSVPSLRPTPRGAPPLSQNDDSTSGLAPVLRTLPRDLHEFANRQAEIEQLLRSIDRLAAPDATFPIHTVGGMPGVGKTAFAIHVGHLLAPRFPDGQLFLDLNGHTPGRLPVAPSEALASLLLADGVPPQMIPAGDDPWVVNEARAALWRSRIADRRMLVIFDNAASFQQVEHLLPTASAAPPPQLLSPQCRACPLLEVCGGGYLPHRHSAGNGYCNPSVYCRDLDHLIRHIRRHLAAQDPVATAIPDNPHPTQY